MKACFFLAAAGLLAASAAHAEAPVKQSQTGLGTVLTDEHGMTLYTFDKDEPGKSNCTDACAKNWPPLAAAGDAKTDGGYSVIQRADGSKQWAYKNKPLYLWSKDSKPGDTSGDGFKDIWHAAKP